MTILNTRTAGPGFGVFIDDIDLRDASDSQLATIRQLLFEHGVVFFHGQQLAPEDHIRLANAIGEIEINRYFTPVAGHPEIAEVIKEPDQTYNFGGNWHTDMSYDPAPALGSILHALQTPPSGGDTIFVGMQAGIVTLT